ncbi:MAG: hypothetical protein MZU97_02195 [Bacillus subtilis]|nr:hypothetical protein [Bacillus subtilis]
MSIFISWLKWEGIKLYSLQKGSGVEELELLPDGIEIINLGETFNDFSDTASAIAGLNLVIGVDTAVTNLSGAMGIPTWTLIPYASSRTACRVFRY